MLGEVNDMSNSFLHVPGTRTTDPLDAAGQVATYATGKMIHPVALPSIHPLWGMLCHMVNKKGKEETEIENPNLHH